ncbi:XAC2610-related protein [Acinetobacter sp.]|uniref:XAC2610-related protein n=1 Tax=Acinetobacter sp. TaxID=472 RepID=UPI0038910E74
MKTKLLLCIVVLTFSNLSKAETVLNAPEYKPLNNVRVSMQRMLRSTEGSYFLSLYAGILNPHATLYDIDKDKIINLKGLQRGTQLNLKSVDSDDVINKTYQLSGIFDANSGDFKGILTEGEDTLGKPIQFEPAIKVSDKPYFILKFYGLEDIQQPYGSVLKRVDIVNKNNVTQALTGFTAFPKSIGYMDVNFDGYYDIILSDISEKRTIQDKRYIYWIFNPQTRQFQRSPQLEKIVGFPKLRGDKQQIDFGNGQLYQVEKGLLSRTE